MTPGRAGGTLLASKGSGCGAGWMVRGDHPPGAQPEPWSFGAGRPQAAASPVSDPGSQRASTSPSHPVHNVPFVQAASGVEYLLAGLTPAQRAAVTSDAAPLCLLASAGAGKTRVLTRRIAYRVRTGTAEPRHTLALTFTRKAAGELQERLRQLGLREQVSAGTFHALASAQLRRWWADRGQPAPAVLERKARLLGSSGIEPARRWPGCRWRSWPGISSGPRPVWCHRRGSRRPSARPGGHCPRRCRRAAIAGLYARYQDEKLRRGPGRLRRPAGSLRGRHRR